MRSLIVRASSFDKMLWVLALKGTIKLIMTVSLNLVDSPVRNHK